MEVIETLIGQAVSAAKDNGNAIESTNKLSNRIKRVENIIFRLIQVKISHKFKIIKVYTKFFKC